MYTKSSIKLLTAILAVILMIIPALTSCGKTNSETFCAGLYTALPSRALRGVAFTSVRGSNNFMTHANEFKRKYGYDELTEKDIDEANYRLGKWYMCKDNPSDTQIWKSWEDTIR